jgi:hypothetical protein
MENLKYPSEISQNPPSQIFQVDQNHRAVPSALAAVVAGMDDDKLDTPYRDGGWTIRQVVHHLADSHINSYVRFRLALTEDNPVIKPMKKRYGRSSGCQARSGIFFA